MQPRDLLRTARKLLYSKGRGRPRQTDLRRAISTAYYAIFHALCHMCANCLSGTDRNSMGWMRTYRALEHRQAYRQFRRIMSGTVFSQDIHALADAFVLLQEKRHLADYDPKASFALQDALFAIDLADYATNVIKNMSFKERKELSLWLLLRDRGN